MAAWQDFFLSGWSGGPAPVTGTATFTQAPATWDATAAERFPATAAFAQSATWAATGLERFAGTSTWDQSATWAGEASERFTTATAFDQAAAEWLAVALNVPPLPPLTFSAGFTQDAATFDAKAIHWVVVLVWDRIALAVNGE